MNKTKEQSKCETANERERVRERGSETGKEEKTMKEKLKCCDNLVACNLTDISRSTLKGLQINTHTDTHTHTHIYQHPQPVHRRDKCSSI